MNYTILLWPHANARYRTESARLALAELEMLLRRIAPDAKAAVGESAEVPTLEIQCASPLSDADVAALRGLSLLYALFERRGDALIPLAGREQAYLGEDLPGILKYKGKTNELFTQLLVNVALYCGDYWASPEPIRLLDPMCGRGTTLFVGANRGWQCTGTDVDKADLKEAETFFKRYLEYHRFKHALERESFTLKGKKSAPGAAFTFADTPEHFRQRPARPSAAARSISSPATCPTACSTPLRAAVWKSCSPGRCPVGEACSSPAEPWRFRSTRRRSSPRASTS